jgi:hypothetical protein
MEYIATNAGENYRLIVEIEIQVGAWRRDLVCNVNVLGVIKKVRWLKMI